MGGEPDARARRSSCPYPIHHAGPLDQPPFTERGVVASTSDIESDGTVPVRHPFLGPMTVEVGAQGRLQTLDAGATTHTLVVRRVAGVAAEAAARR